MDLLLYLIYTIFYSLQISVQLVQGFVVVLVYFLYYALETHATVAPGGRLPSEVLGWSVSRQEPSLVLETFEVSAVWNRIYRSFCLAADSGGDELVKVVGSDWSYSGLGVCVGSVKTGVMSWAGCFSNLWLVKSSILTVISVHYKPNYNKPLFSFFSGLCQISQRHIFKIIPPANSLCINPRVNLLF